MYNKSVSDFVAATMNAVLNSAEHKSLFNKYATDLSDASDSKSSDESCCGDSLMADDQEVNDADDQDDQDADDSCESCDSCDADDCSSSEEGKTSEAFNVAIDSLLTASAALDSVGMDKSASFSLKLASLVVEAKAKAKKEDKKKSDKKKSDKKDSKKDSKKPSSSSSKSSKDKNDARKAKKAPPKGSSSSSKSTSSSGSKSKK